MELVFFWLLFAAAVGVAANKRGRSGFLWFLFSVLLSPLVGLILVLVSRDLSTAAQVRFEEAPRPETHVRCPDCKELVRKDAVKCRHCGAALKPM